MKLRGFYRVIFAGSLPGIGGVIAIDGGIIRGADDQFLYSGSIQMKDGVNLNASIKVQAYVTNALPVFGSRVREFTLELHGSAASETEFTLNGHADLPGTPAFHVRAIRVGRFTE